MSTLIYLKLVFYFILIAYILYARYVVHKKELKASGKISVPNVVLTLILLVGLFFLVKTAFD
jgi:uncharacterized membrane protein SirB2